MTRTVIACLVLILMTPLVQAEVQPELAAWSDGPEGFLLTADERAAWSALSTDEEAEAFIELFWVRRDPDLATRINEFKVDFDLRVAAADAQFGEGETRGALTDRGKTLLLLGAPERPYSTSISDYLVELYREPPQRGREIMVNLHGVTFDRYKGRADVWEYGRQQLPPEIQLGKKVTTVAFAFLDVHGDGTYRTATSLRRAQTGAEVLAAIPEILRSNPDLDSVPDFPLWPGAEAASAEQVGWLGAEAAPWPEGAQALVAQGVALEDIYPAWVFLRLPTTVAAADQLVGRLILPDGKVEGTFRVAAHGIESALGTVYELPLPAPVGQSTLQLAAASGSNLIAATVLEIEIAEVEEGSTYITPLFSGGEIVEQRDFEAGTPFIFGGYHLILRPDGAYEKTDALNYLGLVVRPGTAEDGSHDFKIRVRLKRKGKQLSSSPLRDLELSPVAPDVFMFGAPLPLDFLPQGGEYSLRITVSDKISDVEQVTEIPFRLPETGGEPAPAAGSGS